MSASVTPPAPPWYARVESIKRSQMTQSPRSSAGRTTRSTWVGARRGEQQGFGARAPAVGVAGHQQGADRFCSRRATGFARQHDRRAALAQRLGQSLRLRRFADALATLERDEHPARGHADHAPNRDFSPAHARPKNPASPTAFSATSGMTCGGVDEVSTIRSAMCWPLAIGALIGPS